MCEASIRVSGVHKAFGTQQVLRGVNLETRPGEIAGLLGRNGSGKSVLLRCILGLMPVDAGSIYVNQEAVRGAPPRTPIGFIIDTPGFLPTASAQRNMAIVASIRRIAGREDIQSTLERVGLDPGNRKRVKYYSTGMKQRLALAMALMEDPDILLLDEPLTGLDQAGVLFFRDILRGLAAQGKTILMTSHIQDDIEILCDRRYAMLDGVLTEG